MKFLSNLSRTSVSRRFQSTISGFNTPEIAASFFGQNKKLIEKTPPAELSEIYFSFIDTKARQGCHESDNYLKSFKQYQANNSPYILFKGLKNRKLSREDHPQFLKFFGNMLGHRLGYVAQSADNEIEILTKEKAGREDHPQPILLPHTDGMFDHPPLKFMVFMAVDAAHKNYRTYFLDEDEVIKRLPKKSLEILREEIFYDFANEGLAQPIVTRSAEGYEINFSTETSVNSWGWDLNRSKKTYFDNDVYEAVKDIHATILSVYKDNKMKGEVYLETGDVAGFKNKQHGRDQNGVPEKVKLYDRTLNSLAFTSPSKSRAVQVSVADLTLTK